MKQIDYVLLGNRLKEKREEQGFTQEQLGEASELSSVHISLVENAKRKPSLQSLLQICNALQITMDELLVGNQHPSQNDYQSDLSYLLSQAAPIEKRFIITMIRSMINIFRENKFTLVKK